MPRWMPIGMPILWAEIPLNVFGFLRNHLTVQLNESRSSAVGSIQGSMG